MVAVERAEVDTAVRAGDRRATMVRRILGRLSFHLSGVQLGITIASVVLGLVAEPTIGRLIEPAVAAVVSDGAAAAVSVLVALLAATAAQMVLGELVPKAIAVSRPFRTARVLARPAGVYSTIFTPVIVVFGGVADMIVRRLGIEPTEELRKVRSRRELVDVVSSSGIEGTLELDEVTLLTRAFRFGEKVAADALTPRPDVVAIDSDATVADLVELSLRTGISRFPVIGADLDEVVGVVHVKATFDVAPDRRDSTPVSTLMDEPLVVPESAELDELLVTLRRAAVYLAVVGDEYGGTAGIITLEDLLEEIVGEIDDEHDRTRHRLPLWRVGGDVMASGRLHLDSLTDATGARFAAGDFETLGGLVMDRLGRIPSVGDRFDDAGWSFEVTEMDRRRVAMVRLTPPAAPDDAAPEEDDS